MCLNYSSHSDHILLHRIQKSYTRWPLDKSCTMIVNADCRAFDCVTVYTVYSHLSTLCFVSFVALSFLLYFSPNLFSCFEARKSTHTKRRRRRSNKWKLVCRTTTRARGYARISFLFYSKLICISDVI